MTAPIDAGCMLYQFLTVNGDGTGTFEANADFSGGNADEFFIQPPSNKIFAIETIAITIQDNSKISADKYGGITALTNGIGITVEDSGGTILDITSRSAIKTNGEWASYFNSMRSHTFGTGDELIVIYWKISDTGRSLFLDGSKGEKLVFSLSDDFSGLTEHRFFAHGATGDDFQNTPGFHV